MNIRKDTARLLHRIAATLEKGNNTKAIPHTAETDELVDYTTDCSYEAAWYMTQGAQFVRMKDKELSYAKQQRVGHRSEWIIYLTNVPKRAIMVYHEGQAQVKVEAFKRERKRLKRNIKSYLDMKYAQYGTNKRKNKNHVGHR